MGFDKFRIIRRCHADSAEVEEFQRGSDAPFWLVAATGAATQNARMWHFRRPAATRCRRCSTRLSPLAVLSTPRLDAGSFTGQAISAPR